MIESVICGTLDRFNNAKKKGRRMSNTSTLKLRVNDFISDSGWIWFNLFPRCNLCPGSIILNIDEGKSLLD